MGKLLVEKHLAACVNIVPIESVYEWQGQLVEDKEAALLIKTNEPKVAEIEEFILKNHSYSVPLAAVVDVRRVNREYKEWMSAVINL